MHCLRLMAMVCSCLLLLVPSCVVMHEKTANGDSATYASLGGKGAYRKGVGLIHNHEKSFRDGAIAATAIGGSIASTMATKASEQTAQAIARESSKRHAAEQVTQQAAISAEVQKAEIAAKAAEEAAAVPVTVGGPLP